MSTKKRSRSGSGGYFANSYRTQGIILRTYKLAESDRIIVMLTEDHGQVRAVAKGIRRTSSKFGATLEPFMHTRAQIVRGKSLDIIGQTQIIHPYGSMITTDYDAYGAASTMVETAEKLTLAEDTDVSRVHFRLLYGALAVLARGKQAPKTTADSYILRALSVAGWAPSFTDCARCGEPGPHDALSVRGGGVVCENCREPRSHYPEDDVLKLLSALLAGDWDVVDSIPDKYRPAASKFVEKYLEFHLERNIHSFNVMSQRPTMAPPRTSAQESSTP